MNNREDNNFIDVESSPVLDGEQVAWRSCFDEKEPKKKKKRRGARIFGTIAGGILISLIGGIIGSAITYSMIGSNRSSFNSKTTNYVPQSFVSSTNNAMSAADAFNKVAPAVVIVSTKGFQDVNYGFFSQEQEVEGIGSGFIINEEGYILTNYHVIKGATEVTVTLSTGDEVPATVVNYEETKDIAMLKLKEGTKVPAVAELGDSDAIYPGAEVIAIGTPLSKNFAQTLTKGVISGSNRTVTTENGESVNLIQTDAAINPGNSGGPLVNTNGEVIGINSMKIGTQAGSTSVEGIGFAIPINEVKNKIDDLSKPILNLGIKVRDIDANTAKQYDLEEGIYVVSVDEFSPAEKGGLKVGDIIVKCDGKSATTLDKLKEIKQTKNAGDTLGLEVVRNGKNVKLNVTLEEGK
ncbi:MULTISPECIES: trypsin-like peptidase domain-containing protein [Clostridium]|uniref:S1C family serine protease n=1 Tax=Clostridium TaxID=1485 RepID=UPI0012E65954|nr:MULTISPECIES: trypsin-like peptidase domain-containing protein [Clostridium]MBS4784061.1 trypsin-like peptidase domain-containing protein [Clostridium sp.]CAG9705979.1 Putative serine protease Do, Htr [Clostridium neonatale]SUQ42197.1 Serine protease Do-like HtrA [Clostridium neonatale]